MEHRKISREKYAAYSGIFMMGCWGFALFGGYFTWLNATEKSLWSAISYALLFGMLAIFAGLGGFFRGVLSGHIDGQIEMLNSVELRMAEQSPVKASTEPSKKSDGVRGDRFEMAVMVSDKFWHPSRFDPADSDTAPKQSDIIDFIKEQRPGISDATARAIEKIACPIDR